MSEKTADLRATFKAGTGYDAPWLTVDAATPDELSFKLDALLEGDVFQKMVTTAELLHGAYTVASTPAVSAQQQAAPPQQNAAGWSNSPAATAPAWSGAQQGGPQNGSPHPENRGCSGCGQVLQYKAFQSKAGKALKMWACPNQKSKGDGHDTVWVD